MGKKTHLHDYRATRISIKIPLCVFMGVGTARGAKEPRSAVYALHPSIFPRALCHHVRGSPSESPLPGSNKHKGRSRAPALTLPAAGQQRLRSETKTALEKKKRKKTVGKKHKGTSALSHWILNLGLPDTQVGTDCSREQLVEESLRGKCERISCWDGGNLFPSAQLYLLFSCRLFQVHSVATLLGTPCSHQQSGSWTWLKFGCVQTCYSPEPGEFLELFYCLVSILLHYIFVFAIPMSRLC